MEMVLKDRDGNEILSPRLTQWDQGVTIIIRDFYYPVDAMHHAFLHFYNVTKSQIYSPDDSETGGQKQYDSESHTLSCQVPNALLQEPHPIIVHVFVTEGSSLTGDNPIKARTVFTATIGVEPRMQPANYMPTDNTGTISADELREQMRAEIEAWESDLSSFYGTVAPPVQGNCYYDNVTQKMYADAQYTNEIVGESGVIYRTYDTGRYYFYGTDAWVEMTVTGTMLYAKDRADACDETQAQTLTAFEGVLNVATDHCMFRVSASPPTAAEYAAAQDALDADSPLKGAAMITFVVAEE